MKTTLISKNKINKILRIKSKTGNRSLQLSSLFTTSDFLQFNIIEDKKSNNKPEIHVREGDLFYCLKGQVDFICGGILSNGKNLKHPNGQRNIYELTGSDIKNGTYYNLKAGDWLWIPPNTPHQHNSTTLANLIIIKIRYKI